MNAIQNAASPKSKRKREKRGRNKAVRVAPIAEAVALGDPLGRALLGEDEGPQPLSRVEEDSLTLPPRREQQGEVSSEKRATPPNAHCWPL